MTCLRLFRLFAVVFVLFRMAVGPTHAEHMVCPLADAIRIQDARLVIDPAANPAGISLSGHALINGSGLDVVWANALCVAAFGTDFQVNKTRLCERFGWLSSKDRISPDGRAIEFLLASSVPLHETEDVSLELQPGQHICSAGVSVELRPGLSHRFGNIEAMPNLLTSDRAVFEIEPGEMPRGLKIKVLLEAIAPEEPEQRPLNEPSSWTEPIKGVSVAWIAQALLLAFFLRLFLAYVERANPLPAGIGLAWSHLETPLRAALALYTAAALMDLIGHVAVLVLALPLTKSIPSALQAADIVTVSRWLGVVNLNAPMEFGLVTASLIAIKLFQAAFYFPLRGFGAIGLAIAFSLRVASRAALICWLALLFSLLVMMIGHDMQWIGFEAPALLVSMAYACFGIASVGALYGLTRAQVLGLALLVALTAFFPTDPVIRSSGVVTIGDNTHTWARFLFFPAAIYTYIAALAGFAFCVGRSDEIHDHAAGRWLIFLLILQIAAFGIRNPANMVAVVGVVMVASIWLLAPSDRRDDAAVAASSREIWELEEDSFPFVVGGTAAAIFLMQLLFDIGQHSDRFTLLSLANVPRVFAIGAVAGLVLARLGPLLRGDSATLKALNISALIMITNIAASLSGLHGRARVLAVIASNLGVIASLILSAVFVYDLKRAKTGNDGQLEWRNLFKGTTLARSVPIISAVAVALFSALSPIFIHEIGDAFGSLLKAALPQVTPQVPTGG
jgi:hypothetical protein